MAMILFLHPKAPIAANLLAMRYSSLRPKIQMIRQEMGCRLILVDCRLD